MNSLMLTASYASLCGKLKITKNKAKIVGSLFTEAVAVFFGEAFSLRSLVLRYVVRTRTEVAETQLNRGSFLSQISLVFSEQVALEWLQTKKRF
jgi:hypothetical protein